MCSLDALVYSQVFLQMECKAKGFKGTINKSSESSFLKQVSWDASHWINLAVTDVRDGKEFIKQTNRFSEVVNRGGSRLPLRSESIPNYFTLE